MLPGNLQMCLWNGKKIRKKSFCPANILWWCFIHLSISHQFVWQQKKRWYQFYCFRWTQCDRMADFSHSVEIRLSKLSSTKWWMWNDITSRTSIGFIIKSFNFCLNIYFISKFIIFSFLFSMSMIRNLSTSHFKECPNIQ